MPLLLTALSTVCASVPMLVFVALVRWMDRYDREPVGLVALAFLWGASGGVVFGMLSTTVMLGGAIAGIAAFDGLDPTAAGAILGQVVIAPLAEEPAKALILVPIALSRHFDDMPDGFVYGAAAGLGFAMTENFLYFVSAAGDPQLWFGTVVIRTFYSAGMHATASAAVGAGLGWGKFRGRRGLVRGGAAGLLVALGVHGLWNGLLTLDQLLDGSLLWHVDLVLLPALVLGAVAVFEGCVAHEQRVIRAELSEEADAGLLPAAHVDVVASWWRRLGTGWLPAEVDRHAYVVAATTLALRKQQVRLMHPHAPAAHLEDVARLRGEIGRLLRAPPTAPAPSPRTG